MTIRTPRRPRGAFTLIEVLVVVVILALVTALVVPRLTGSTRRTFELVVDQVTDLLVMYAQRDHLSRRPIGLALDPERRTLELLVLDSNPSDPEAPATWRHDYFVQPVKLPPLIDVDAILVFADGDPVDIRGWPLTNTPGEARPTIELFIRTDDQAHEATLRLAPHAVVPERIGDLYVSMREPIDLDSVGRAQEDW